MNIKIKNNTITVISTIYVSYTEQMYCITCKMQIQEQPPHPCSLIRVFLATIKLLSIGMDDSIFYALFNSISVMSGSQADDNERLCAMEPHLLLNRSVLSLS